MKRLVLIVAVSFTVMSAGAAGWLWLQPPSPERARARIQQLGGRVHIEESSQDRPVVKVDLTDCPAGDDDLEYLIAFPHLQYLILTGTRISGEGLKRLSGLKELHGLALSGPAAGGEGLRHLGALTGLHELRLEKTTLTDAGLTH